MPIHRWSDYLGDNENVFPLLSEFLANFLDVSCLANEGSKDDVYTLLHPELQVAPVLLRDRWEVHDLAWEVHSLFGA